MEEILDRIISWCDERPKGPTQAQVHLTNFCNLRCFFCPTRTLVDSSEIRRDREIREADWLRIIEEGERMGVLEWHLCGGGEPLLFRKEALAGMRRIKEYGRLGEVITNGTLFDDETAREMVEIGWDKITVSLDGPDAAVNDPIRGTGSFDKVVEGIRNLQRWRSRIGGRQPHLCLHMVVCDRNFRSVAEMVELTARLGVDDLLVNAMNLWSDEIAAWELQPEAVEPLRAVLEEARALAERKGVSSNIAEFLRFDLFRKANLMDRKMSEEVAEGDQEQPEAPPLHPLAQVPCYYPWYNLAIFADGIVKPCYMLKTGGVSLFEHTLDEIWESGYFFEIRKQMLENRLTGDCAQCNPWSFSKTKEIRGRLVERLGQKG